MTAPWLTKHIETSRRAATRRRCPKCRSEVLVGPDHDRVAATARVDPEPVNEQQEAAALAAGRYSYDLDRGELHMRYPHHIKAPRKYPVLVDHQCTKQLTLGGDTK